MQPFETERSGRRIIGWRFVAWVTIGGKRIYPSQYGKKAFRIPIYAK